MPGVLLAVQLPEDVHRAVARMDVEHSVHVGAPVDGVPAGERPGGRGQEDIKADTNSTFLLEENRKNAT